MIWVHTVCLYAKCKFEKFARRCSRRHKQTTFPDAVFLGALRVKRINKWKGKTNKMMMIWCFKSLSTLFKSYWAGGRMIMKGSVQRSAVQSWAELSLQQDSNPRSLKSGVLTTHTQWPGWVKTNKKTKTTNIQNAWLLADSRAWADQEYMQKKQSLTLVLLNKLRCHTYFLSSANQITWSRVLL